jgi:hypothetical protein
LHDRNTIIINSCNLANIAENLLTTLDPKIIVKYKQCSNWNKWKKSIDVALTSPYEKEGFNVAIPNPPRVFPIGFKWVFIHK